MKLNKYDSHIYTYLFHWKVVIIILLNPALPLLRIIKIFLDPVRLMLELIWFFLKNYFLSLLFWLYFLLIIILWIWILIDFLLLISKHTLFYGLLFHLLCLNKCRKFFFLELNRSLFLFFSFSFLWFQLLFL